MCRIGSIKCLEPVQPAMALRLMLPQQEGHDNSGFALVMQDLEGVFGHYKDKPLLSLACTAKGLGLVDDYMEEKGFVQVAQWVPDTNPRDGLKIEVMQRYVFRNYDYPEIYRYRTQKEREEFLLDTRLELRKLLEEHNGGYVYSFWPDVLTLKEIGDPALRPQYCGPVQAKYQLRHSALCGPSIFSAGLYTLRQWRKYVLYKEYGISEKFASRLCRF